jgi:hypothetical protein
VIVRVIVVAADQPVKGAAVMLFGIKENEIL